MHIFGSFFAKFKGIRLSRRGIRVLEIDFWILLFFSLLVIFSLSDLCQADRVLGISLLPAYLDYIFCGLVISVGSALLLDVLERDTAG